MGAPVITERDRDLFLVALNKLCVTNPSMTLVAPSEVMVPAIAAARAEGRLEAIEECAKIADDCDNMVGRHLAAAIAAKIRNLK